jgi:endonuclease/exonuclease/phosphatase family metal-dependent hydrolase
MGSTVERLLVRTWNLFHGNTQPPGRRAFLEEIVRLASADEPHVVCLQEVPVWATDRLIDWTEMTAVTDVARRAPLGAELGRTITALHSGLFRSTFNGQANAVLLRPELSVLDHRRVALNPFKFRRAQAGKLGLGFAARVGWAKERRICQALRVRSGRETFVVGNLHATHYPPDLRLADAELLRAAVFLDGFALPDEPIVLCGDFNVSVQTSKTLAELMRPEWGFEGPTPVGVDHVLVRGPAAEIPHRWPPERRLREGKLLSDHAPVEREVG